MFCTQVVARKMKNGLILDIMKVEATGCLNGLDVGCERNKEE